MSTAVTDVVRPFQDSDLLVRRRWYPIADGSELLGAPTVFWSNRWEPFPYLPKGAGEVYGLPVEYPRVGTPAGLPNDHVCDVTALESGGFFDPDANVTYDDEWIPECCGRDSVCVTQLCATDEVFDRPAAQLWSYNIPHQDATGLSPVFLFSRANNQGDVLPGKPGWLTAYYPKGRDNDPGWSLEQIATTAGVMESEVESIRFAADNAITTTKDATGYTFAAEHGGDAGSFTLKMVGGVLEVCGVNAQICKAILPPDVSYRDGAGLLGNLITAMTPVGPGVHLLHSVTSLTRFYVLQDLDGAQVDVYPSDAVGAFGAVVFPPSGQSFNGLAINTPVAITNAAAPFFAWRFVRTVHPILGDVVWQVLKYRADGTVFDGTVTSVDIATTSAAVVVGGGPITGAGTLTVDVDPAVDDLVALASVDGILAGDGAGGLATVTIGAYLTYSGGVLDVVPSTATNGQKVCSTFNVTGTSGTYQATGDTFTLPTAGTYLITAQIRGEVQPSVVSIATLLAKLRDNTAAGDVPNTETLLARSVGTANLDTGTSSLTTIYTVAGSATLELYAARTGTSWTTSRIASDAGGRTVVNWAKLSN